MTRDVSTFLMFEGRAEEAMNLYVSLFEDGEVRRLERWGSQGPGVEGQVYQGAFAINGRQFMVFDSPPGHAFTFTPAMSIFVTCSDEAEIDRLYGALIEGGEALMPMGDYGFSRRFGWLNDRFGVSWQFNLPHA